jgi:outer membrane protein assembly factor BamA
MSLDPAPMTPRPLSLLHSLALAASLLLTQGAGALQATPVVASVEFPGRMNVDETACRNAISLKPGELFTPAKLEADRKLLLGLGYFRSVGAAQSTAEGRTQVSFRVVEWPRVQHIRVLGNTVVDSPAIRAVITTKLGQVLCGPQLANDVRAIEKLYRDRGYVARISERILDEVTKSGILRFDVLEARIAEVVVEGGTPRQRQRAQKTVRELPPRLYRPEDVALDQGRLLKISGVKDALSKAETVSPGQVKIVWHLNPPAESRETSKP